MKILDPKMREPAPTLTSPQPARIVPCAAPPPDSADEDFADGSVEMNGDGSQLRVALALQAAQPLVADRTVYVHSATGSDANDGSQAAPFKTLMRALAERSKYGTLRAKFQIQLLGVGPYTLDTSTTRVANSACDGKGLFMLDGDIAAETTHYTGTFSGDFLTGTCAINTSAGLGADTYKGRFVRVTSGLCAGAEFPILEHTDTQIIAVSKRFRTIGAIAAGDTFKVFTPGTVVNGVSAIRINEWWGGDPNTADSIKHVFRWLLFSTFVGFSRSQVVLLSCRLQVPLVISHNSQISSATFDSLQLGASHTNLYRSAGSTVIGNISMTYGGMLQGAWCHETGSIGLSNQAQLELLGGRIGAVSVSNGAMFRIGTAGTQELAVRCDNTITIDALGDVVFAASNTLTKFVVTAGSCVRVRRLGRLIWQSVGGPEVSGGTTDPAGFGIDVSGGGQALLVVAPTLTGGTASKDLKTTGNGGVANSTLSAAGTAAGVAADALLGEVLARVA